MSLICLVQGGVVGLGYILSNDQLCNHMFPQSGGGTWGTSLYTVRGVGSGSRDVDVWHTNDCTPSHSQTSRESCLLTSSLSLGVPVPRSTQCMRDV
jgi:hypothetical protein